MKIFGHEKIENFLNKCAEKNTLSHAYLFWGPENVGKMSLALEFSRKLTGQKDSQVNPNLIVIEPSSLETKGIVKKQDIKVEEIREMQKKISLSPGKEKYNVAIINEAGYLTASAQNSLLKTLEEPPQNSVIILITDDKNTLLPTVLSRCQKIRFSSLSEADMEKIVPAGAKNREKIIFWSMGRPGLSQKMIAENDNLKLREDSKKDLSCARKAEVYEKFNLAEALSKNVPLALEKLDFWTIILRKDMLDNKDGEEAGEVEIIEKIITARETIRNTNANVRLVLENLFLEF